ncbi:hypothetical protein [Thalassomonas sp. RHCl1]|uniref:hypothetical protein n=1 Tax=Thalassomonas sp. RHCl1 TaxID=2995320 RepID=UPI00248BD8E9|nr:hypothetical protein [Thalassomonas sp. RHCl1]
MANPRLYNYIQRIFKENEIFQLKLQLRNNLSSAPAAEVSAYGVDDAGSNNKCTLIIRLK